jgi:hypothetical protein
MLFGIQLQQTETTFSHESFLKRKDQDKKTQLLRHETSNKHKLPGAGSANRS